MENNSKKHKKVSGGIIVLSVITAIVICVVAGMGVYYGTQYPSELFIDFPPLYNNTTMTPTEAVGSGGFSTAYIDPNVTELPNITAPPIDSNEPIADLYDKLKDTVVMVCSYDNSVLQGTGSGVIFTEDGYVITNHHVIVDADSVSVVLYDESEIDAVVVGSDKRTDIAVLKMNVNKNHHAAALGNSDTLRIGQTVVAIGSPLGYSGTLTQGIVSYLNRPIDTDGVRQRMIQTDCAINPGNSGGPLFNLSGEVIGITSMKEVYTNTENGEVPVEGVGYAIPINTAKNIALELISNGYIKRGAIGIMAQSNIADNSYAGVKVVEVTAGGPADKAGVKVNDVIVEIDGVSVEKMEDLSEQLSYKRIGDTVVIKLLRNKTEMTMNITLNELVE